jgi:hypothetical protein
MLKLGFTIAIVVVTAGAVWIEQGHRVVVEPLAAEALAAKACPATDAVPYSPRCLEFIAVDPPPRSW